MRDRPPDEPYCSHRTSTASTSCCRIVEGGVNRSLNLDWYGKSFSYLLLALELYEPCER